MKLANRIYDVVGLPVTIWFNKWGDHDHNGLMFALEENETRIKAFLAEAAGKQFDAERIANPGYELIRPLVLRACVGDTLTINLTNKIEGRDVGLHLVGEGYDVAGGDGADVGRNPSSLVPYGKRGRNEWTCEKEGVFVFHDAGNLSGMQDGTNLHGLFGALIVEPADTEWRDPVSGEYARESGQGGEAGDKQWFGDGLYVDIVPSEAKHLSDAQRTAWIDRPVNIPRESPENGSSGGRAFASS